MGNSMIDFAICCFSMVVASLWRGRTIYLSHCYLAPQTRRRLPNQYHQVLQEVMRADQLLLSANYQLSNQLSALLATLGGS